MSKRPLTCVACGEPLVQYDPNVFVHPACDPFNVADESEADWVKAEMTKIIKWADSHSPRSLQTNLGPSELGSPCDRRLGYRMAGTPECNNNRDPWAAIVGTAIHKWLEDATNRWCTAHANTDWVTEKGIEISEVVSSHPDLFNVPKGMVIDHKSVSADRMKEVRKDGPPIGHQVQVHTYGYAYERLGYKVNTVGLAFYPRSGWLRHMFVWTAPYDRNVAERALARPPSVAAQLVGLGVLDNPHRWEQVPAVPGNDCGWCPWYNPNRTAEQGASEQGCPGT
jgi:uncharacterized Zn finger protein (UPF0148 family)